MIVIVRTVTHKSIVLFKLIKKNYGASNFLIRRLYLLLYLFPICFAEIKRNLDTFIQLHLHRCSVMEDLNMDPADLDTYVERCELP